tara:strand:+ start:1058 stop:1615 length:558 start_codon:yes stop_codon:yes gene_type:complete
MFPICGWTIKGKPALIGFAGKARSGKDTAGAYLVDKYHFLRYSFAQPLKDGAKAMFNLTDEQMENKEKVIEPWGRSPRELYQLLGTDIARTIDKRVWIKNAEMFMKKSVGRSVVITDVRFKNEAEWIKSLGGVVIFLESKTRGIHTRTLHASENGLDMNDVDVYIENDSTINALYEKIESLKESP